MGEPIDADAHTAPSQEPTGPVGDASLELGATERDPTPLDDRERELDPRVIIGWRVSAAIWTALVVSAAVVGVRFLRPDLLIPAVAVAGIAGVAWVVWYPRASLHRWRWRLTDRAIELRHGVIVHRHDAVPYFRIQQIDISQGPIDRMLGLAGLTVTSASAAGSADLPGIPADLAPNVRAELLRRAEASLGEQSGDRDAV